MSSKNSLTAIMHPISKLAACISLSLFLCVSGFSQLSESIPTYVDGKDALIKHISERLTFPKECRVNNQEGTAYVSIHVDTTGEVDAIELGEKGHVMPKFWLSAAGMAYPTSRPVVEGPSIHFDQAVATALEGLGKFHPATRDGEPVDSWLTFPVFFDVYCCPKKAQVPLSIPGPTP